MHHTPRWDRLALRGLVCLAVAASTVPALLVRSADLPVWRQVLVWLGTVVLCWSIAVWGVSRRPARPFPVAAWAAVTALAATMVTVSVPGNQGLWIPYLGTAAAAVAGLALPWTALLALPPLLALAWRSWIPGHNPITVAVNVAAAIAVAALVVMRSRQREAAELAEAQRRVIEIERAKMRTRAQQQEVAAQLHDVLAHTLSGLIVTLQGATLAARNERVSPELSGRLDTAVGLAKDGLAEARRAVESLHGTDDAPTTDLGTWLASALGRLRTGAGLSVQVAGSPSVIDSSWIELTRSVVMEALTNTVRHAAGAPVQLTFAGPPDAGVGVLSAGDPTTFVDRHHPSGGHGLAGLAERVHDHGGRLDYGATDDGFEVRLHTSAGGQP